MTLIPAGLDATVVLVRHGESEWITKGLFQGQGDSPLSRLGRLLADLDSEGALGSGGRSPVLGYADEPGDDPWGVIVGHDGVFKVVLLALLDLPLSRFWLLPFALCGITVVEIRGGRPRLRLLNSTDHLATLETAADQATAEAREKTGAF